MTIKLEAFSMETIFSVLNAHNFLLKCLIEVEAMHYHLSVISDACNITLLTCESHRGRTHGMSIILHTSEILCFYFYFFL